MMFKQTIVLGLACLAIAHPGHEDEEHRHAIKTRELHHSNKRALENCAAHLEARGHTDRAIKRRQNTMQKHREERGIAKDGKPQYLHMELFHDWIYTEIFIAPILKRSTVSVLLTDHEGDLEATTAESDETVGSALLLFFSIFYYPPSVIRIY